MEISVKEFLENFSSQFENTDPKEIKFETNFKELGEWDSLISLSLMAMADNSYNVSLTANDIRDSTTVEDLYNIIKNK
jgi:acyl carrier protein